MTYQQINPGGWPVVGDPTVDTVGDFISNQWGSVIVPKLQQGTVGFYASTADRDSNMGTAPAYMTACYTKAEKTWWVYDGGWQAIASQPKPWTSTTPVWYSDNAGNGTYQTMSIGNGTWSARYTTNGKTGHFRMKITRGSTTNGGSGNFGFFVPFSMADYSNIQGTGYATFDGGGLQKVGTVIGVGTNPMMAALVMNDTQARLAFNTTYSTYGQIAGDIIALSLTAEIA